MTHKVWYGLSFIRAMFIRAIPSLRLDNCYCNTEVSVKSTGPNGRLDIIVGIVVMEGEAHSFVVETTTLSSIKIDKEMTVETKRDIYEHEKSKFTVKYCISPPRFSYASNEIGWEVLNDI